MVTLFSNASGANEKSLTSGDSPEAEELGPLKPKFEAGPISRPGDLRLPLALVSVGLGFDCAGSNVAKSAKASS